MQLLKEEVTVEILSKIYKIYFWSFTEAGNH